MRTLVVVFVALCTAAGGVSAQEIFSDGFESGDIEAWCLGVGWRTCDVFLQDCTDGDGCYLIYSGCPYPTYCAPAVPEPNPPDGCGTGLNRPGIQGECCSYINTCDNGYTCIQPDSPAWDHLVCSLFCDPTGTVGHDNCFSQIGPEFYCLSINSFYVDAPLLEDFFGFCIDETIWGPPSCWNGIQDGDEDGVDCCQEPGGNPDCPCVWLCGKADPGAKNWATPKPSPQQIQRHLDVVDRSAARNMRDEDQSPRLRK